VALVIFDHCFSSSSLQFVSSMFGAPLSVVIQRDRQYPKKLTVALG
jgi:hypothetical protein